MMFRNFAAATNGASNGFAGMHASTGAAASSTVPALNGIGAQMMAGLVDASAGTIVPGQGIGAMMNGIAAVNGVNIGTIMSSYWQHLPANGSADATLPAVGAGLGLGPMMGSIAGESGLGLGAMMGGLLQDAQNGTTDASATAPTLPQWMLDHMPGINLVGMPHLNLDFLSANQ
ncbi:MAG: hypothetical protein WC100_21740 [Sterolibacterium sp.]